MWFYHVTEGKKYNQTIIHEESGRFRPLSFADTSFVLLDVTCSPLD